MTFTNVNRNTAIIQIATFQANCKLMSDLPYILYQGGFDNGFWIISDFTDNFSFLLKRWIMLLRVFYASHFTFWGIIIALTGVFCRFTVTTDHLEKFNFPNK